MHRRDRDETLGLILDTTPRCFSTLKPAPSSDCGATAPISTSTRGVSAASSAVSHGRHATASERDGFLCRRRVPRASHRKCLTAFVRYTRPRSMPAASMPSSSTRPAGSDERMPLRVLVIAGLLTDQDELGVGGALPEHDLRALLPEIAPPAARGRATQMLEVAVVGQELLGSLVSAHPNKR